MQRFTMSLVLTLILATAAVTAGPTVVLGPGTGTANFRVPYHQSWDRTLSSDTTYVLTGWYFVDSLHTITIQPGTTILGDSASGGTLIISRGARIFADGTREAPIVFTSAKPAGTRTPGDWGGLIVLGEAPTNKPTTQQIEGGFGTAADNAAMFGGSDPHDNSGIIRFVRIEFPGIAFSQDNEINGLTLGGVGDSTVLEYVQVSYANDDDVEFFGGTVNGKYILTMYDVDDNFDSDYGYSGKLQFLCAVRDKNIFDASASGQSNGHESDNEGSAPYAATPRTSPEESNVTLIGPMADTTSGSVNSKWGYLALLRRATEYSIHNAIMMGWPQGINLRDTLTQRAALDGRLQIRNTSIQSARNPLAISSSPNTGNIPDFSVSTWFSTAGWGNQGATPRRPEDLNLVNPFGTGNAFDPRPSAGSEAATAGTSYEGLDRSFFDSVSYRGAFDPSKPMSEQWTAGWTNLDPQSTDYVTSVEGEGMAVPQQFVLEQNYPNPFNPSTVVSSQLPVASRVKLAVYDLLGREVAVLVNEQRAAGRYQDSFDGAGLASGMYIYRLTAGSLVQAKTMVLMK